MWYTVERVFVAVSLREVSSKFNASESFRLPAIQERLGVRSAIPRYTRGPYAHAVDEESTCTERTNDRKICLKLGWVSLQKCGSIHWPQWPLSTKRNAPFRSPLPLVLISPNFDSTAMSQAENPSLKSQMWRVLQSQQRLNPHHHILVAPCGTTLS